MVNNYIVIDDSTGCESRSTHVPGTRTDHSSSWAQLSLTFYWLWMLHHTKLHVNELNKNMINQSCINT